MTICGRTATPSKHCLGVPIIVKTYVSAEIKPQRQASPVKTTPEAPVNHLLDIASQFWVGCKHPTVCESIPIPDSQLEKRYPHMVGLH